MPAVLQPSDEIQDKLGLELGTKVTIRHSGESGEIRVAFRNLDQFEDFCRRLLQPASRSCPNALAFSAGVS